MHTFHVTIMCLLIYTINVGLLKANAAKKWAGAGTSPNLEQIIVGRCYDYIETVNPSAGKKNCSQIWEAFKSAFANKDPCSILPSDYELFINQTHHAIPPNKSLFWENNKELVHRYADKAKRYMPLGDTLAGWLGDNLDWCGSTDEPGIDYTSCPTNAQCEHNAVESFWRITSVNYAMQSSGEVQIMLNGSAPGGAFPVPSFLSDYEIPNFDTDTVSKINIWVMDEVGGADLDSCGRNSLLLLETMLESKRLSYECLDNYRPVKILQCVDVPDHASCLSNGAIVFHSPWIGVILPWIVLIMNHV
uniref:ADP-ribosyl cyclase/cyclic ADP-ribose hydrolase n=1 Tax=Leptobrachium leishanense TaxID=445787 RepID=A0A8C5LNW2_9ANUR